MRVPLVVLLLAAAASADDIYAKSGDKPIAPDVKVLSEGEKIVYVDKSLKERSFSKDMVGRVEKRRSDVHDCLDRLDAAKDANAMVAVAKWAEGKKFAKAALESHIRQLAFELAPLGVTANAIRAGVTDTPALRRIPGGPELHQRAMERNPSGRATTPEDVATAISVLADERLYWMTGNVIGIDGGEELSA